MRGPMRSTSAGPEFTGWTKAVFKRIGPYPTGVLTDTPRQCTRMIKCECLTWGYLARVTHKWLAGPPICPTDRAALGLAASI
jgi:hypothetical protein